MLSFILVLYKLITIKCNYFKKNYTEFSRLKSNYLCFILLIFFFLNLKFFCLNTKKKKLYNTSNLASIFFKSLYFMKPFCFLILLQ